MRGRERDTHTESGSESEGRAFVLLSPQKTPTIALKMFYSSALRFLPSLRPILCLSLRLSACRTTSSTSTNPTWRLPVGVQLVLAESPEKKEVVHTTTQVLTMHAVTNLFIYQTIVLPPSAPFSLSYHRSLSRSKWHAHFLVSITTYIWIPTFNCLMLHLWGNPPSYDR